MTEILAVASAVILAAMYLRVLAVNHRLRARLEDHHWIDAWERRPHV